MTEQAWYHANVNAEIFVYYIFLSFSGVYCILWDREQLRYKDYVPERSGSSCELTALFLNFLFAKEP